MPVRKVITIDEEKCDGCGECVPACAEGAVQVINGKARLVSDVYCDGLGACLGHCPQGAISMEEREAPEFDEAAVHAHLERLKVRETPVPARPAPHAGHGCPGSMARTLTPAARPAAAPAAHGCPGSAARTLAVASPRPGASPAGDADAASALQNWPVQLHLLPPQAPYFQGAHLLVAADCVPFALPDFHDRLLAGRVVAIGCPKLDDGETYLRKLTAILAHNDVQSVTVAFMEVPCCFGLVQLVRTALQQCGKEIPLSLTKVGIGGAVVSSQ